MYSNSLFRPLAVLTACVSVMGTANAETFGNFIYEVIGSEVSITSHANNAPTSIVFPAEINGLPVRRVTLPLLGSLRTSVQSITIPEGVTTINPSSTNAAVLASITIPNSVTSIPSNLFLNCRFLSSVTLGNGLTSLDGTFKGCTALTTINLPSNLVSLDSTFVGCTGLSQIQIPASVTTINAAFGGCTSLTSVVVPAGMTTLGAGAFQLCTSLQNVTLPNGLVSIGDSAFAGCSSLASIDLPASLTTIGADAFSGCTGFSSVNLPAALKTIGSGAFSGCTGLASIPLPSGLTTIGDNAFDGCTSLTSMTVPESVTVIGDGAFWRCPNLTDIHLPPKFLSSLANIGLDYKPELSTNLLVDGLADRLTSSPAFISELADAIIAKNGHYGLATQANIADVVNDTPQAVRDVLAEIGIEAPVATGITSDLGTLSVKKGKPLTYTVTTSFSASAFFATGLPDGVVIDAATGAISGKPKKVGTYMVLLQAGNPGGGTVGAVKMITVTP